MAKRRQTPDPAYRARKLEQLKREQQEQARRRTRRTVAIVGAIIIVVVGAVVVPALLKGRNKSAADQLAAADAKRPVTEFGVAAADAECSAETTEPTPEEWTRHVNGKVDYPSAPPDGGPHNGATLSTGSDHFYSRSDAPPPERAVHDLEHGMVLAWYDAALPAAEVDALEKVAASAGQHKLRFLAVPWDRGTFPDNRHVVLTAWGVTQRCTRVSGAAVQDFVAKHADAPGLAERNFAV